MRATVRHMSIPSKLSGVPYGPAPRVSAVSGGLAVPPRWLVIHDTGNNASAADEAHYAATRTDAQANWTSCHFYVDTSGPLGSTPLTIEAWAAYNEANTHGWHIEMCGYNAGAAGAVPASTVTLTAQLAARLCALGNIPIVHRGPSEVAAHLPGIVGHWDITQGLHVGTHDDPGPAFNWPAFIAQVNAASTPIPTTTRTTEDVVHVDLELNKEYVFTNPAATNGMKAWATLSADFGDATVRFATWNWAGWNVRSPDIHVPQNGDIWGSLLSSDVRKVSVTLIGWTPGPNVAADQSPVVGFDLASSEQHV
jgi:hypothetical protein